MVRPNRIRRLLDAAADLHACRSMAEFGERAPASVATVVAADVVAYQEIDRRRPATAAQTVPPLAGLDGVERFETLLDQLLVLIDDHPVFRRMADTGRESATAVSDLWSQQRFRTSALYGRVYAELDVQDQLVVGVGSTGTTVRAVPLSRCRWGFSAEEKDDLEQLRPHLALSRSTAVLLDRLDERDRAHDLREQSLRHAGIAVVGVRADGSVSTTTEIERTLHTGGVIRDGRLHGPAAEWWRVVSRLGPADLAQPLRLRDAHGRLILRSTGAGTVVVRRAARVGDVALQSLGLTRREAAVVAALIDGAADTADVARQLDIQPSTVRRHLEQIFRKLGVHTRAQAVAAVLAATDS